MRNIRYHCIVMLINFVDICYDILHMLNTEQKGLNFIFGWLVSLSKIPTSVLYIKRVVLLNILLHVQCYVC